MPINDYFKSKEWIELKQSCGAIKTDKVLTRIEYLKEVGAKNFTEKTYQQYLSTINELNKKE